MSPSPSPSRPSDYGVSPAVPDDDSVDFHELWRRVLGGLPRTLGLAALGFALGAIGYFLTGPFQLTTTSARVVFSFPGYERGQYPDKSKFQPDDLRAPEVVAEALRRQGMDTTAQSQAKVRGALSIEGIIPASVIKERDRLRASGQAPAPYVPDEYAVSLNLTRDFPLTSRQRELLLNEIVSVYLENFQRTYVAVPLGFGNAFESIAGADYFDYELVLAQENQNISAYLAEMAESAKSFRSVRTNLSFSDLLKQSQLFTQIRLNETLGLIRQFGLSKDRTMALLKMDYYLRTLNDQENKAVQEEQVVQRLLAQAQERTQNYVLGVKSQASQQRPDGPVIDQGLVDSLLANDAYNFLVRQALEAGLKTRRIQAEKTVLVERRNNMEGFLKASRADQNEVIAQFERSLAELKATYEILVKNIRLTHEDYQRQRYADAARISMQPITASFLKGLALAAAVGLIVGAALGLGMALVMSPTARPSESA